MLTSNVVVINDLPRPPHPPTKPAVFSYSIYICMSFVTTLDQGPSWKQGPRSLYCAPTLATHPINYLVSSCPLSQSYVFCHAINNVTIPITHINMHTPTVAGHKWAQLPYLLSINHLWRSWLPIYKLILSTYHNFSLSLKVKDHFTVFFIIIFIHVFTSCVFKSLSPSQINPWMEFYFVVT